MVNVNVTRIALRAQWMWTFSSMNFPHMVSSIVRHNFRASNGYAYYQDAEYEDSELGTEGMLDPVSQPNHFCHKISIPVTRQMYFEVDSNLILFRSSS